MWGAVAEGLVKWNTCLRTPVEWYVAWKSQQEGRAPRSRLAESEQVYHSPRVNTYLGLCGGLPECECHDTTPPGARD